MRLIGYIIRISATIPYFKEIDRTRLELLTLFVFNQYLSIYEINKILNKIHKKIAYKNTHKLVRKLIDLKLIEKVTDERKIDKKKRAKGAIYYKLSEEGIFTIIINSSILTNYNKFYIHHLKNKKNLDPWKDIPDFQLKQYKEIFLNHKDSTLFEICLYEWISYETILQLDKESISLLLNYIREFCEKIKDSVEFFQGNIFNPDVSGVMEQLYPLHTLDFNNLKEGSHLVKEHFYLQNLRSIFEIDSEVIRLKKINQNTAIIIDRDDEKLISLEYKNDEKMLEIVSLKENLEKVCFPAESIKKIFLPYNMLHLVVEQLGLPFQHFQGVFSFMIRDQDNDTIGVLKKDNKFIKALGKLNKRYSANYKMLNE